MSNGISFVTLSANFPAGKRKKKRKRVQIFGYEQLPDNVLFDGILPAEEKDTSNLSKADLLPLPSGGARQFNSRLGVLAATSSTQV